LWTSVSIPQILTSRTIGHAVFEGVASRLP
jgi:hypothetical protein